MENAPGFLWSQRIIWRGEKSYPKGLFLHCKIPFHDDCCWEGVCHGTWEAVLMQMIFGKWEPAIIHENLGQNESINALIGRK